MLSQKKLKKLNGIAENNASVNKVILSQKEVRKPEEE